MTAQIASTDRKQSCKTRDAYCRKKGVYFLGLTTPNRKRTQAFTEIGCIGDSVRFGQRLRVLVVTYVHFDQVQIHAGSRKGFHRLATQGKSILVSLGLFSLLYNVRLHCNGCFTT